MSFSRLFYEDFYLLGYNAMYSVENQPAFRKNTKANGMFKTGNKGFEKMFHSDHTFPLNQFIWPFSLFIIHKLKPAPYDCRKIRADGYCLLGRWMCPKESTWSLHKSFALCGLDSSCQENSWGLASVTVYIF